jgi:hypothetical protein
MLEALAVGMLVALAAAMLAALAAAAMAADTGKFLGFSQEARLLRQAGLFRWRGDGEP